MVFVIKCDFLPFNIRGPEVVRVKATVGRPLAALPSEKIDAPLHIHMASELLITEDQTTHALCVLGPFSLANFFFIFIL